MAVKKRKFVPHRNSWEGGAASGTKEKLTSRKGAKCNGGSSIHQLTIYGAVVLVVAIASGLMLNSSNTRTTHNEDDMYKSVINTNLTVDSSFGDFLKTACDENGDTNNSNKAYCGNGKVEAIRRTLQASAAGTRPIRRGDTLVEIPREFHIWEVDALRSNFVQTENLLKARHELTENPLAGGAFLAAYLAHERKRLVDKEKEAEDDKHDVEIARNTSVEKDKLRASYFHSLPSWEELKAHHPLLESRSDLQSMLGHHSWNFAVVVMYQEMIASEYKALATASPKGFGELITVKEYQTARIHVLSRSFNPGSDACSTEVAAIFSPEDLERLQSTWGIRSSNKIFDDGCHAMVPILDMLNSHPRPNVVYKYHSEKQAFVISANAKISSQWELMDSYGKYSDAHLFAKFGFVNGDGSGHTQASIALFHRPLDMQLSQEFTLIPDKVTYGVDDENIEHLSMMQKIPEFQRSDLKRYLMFDDGYDDCVQKDLHQEAFRLKQLKWMHLAKIANDPKSWVATLQPRATRSRPRESSDLLISEAPPQIDPRKLRVDLTHLMDTCRLIQLITDDYEGNAIQILEDNLGNNTFVVTTGSKALEYRSLMCLARIAGTALMQYTPVNLNTEFENVLQLNKENAFGNSTWTAAQLRLGEIQSLHALSGTAMAYSRELSKTFEKEEMAAVAYKMRETSCPREYTDILDEKIE